ncbi:ABC transporter ATP-binding protein [Xinfangfangia sp. D13-10-4-6]|uniref:ABC transporter ATP-binding protein n=1 Tax=Pseudogemmobacter hezensis TaxID=2737662 RepID=UPI003F533039|nr:ABC transporter ATP-binding protein [Pseudogemmobacter hezensis]
MAKDVIKAFGQGETVVRALDNVSVEIKTGEFFTLLGPSGCGKTTLLRLIAGFEMPSSGQILIDGQDVTGQPPNQRAVNTVFQSYALFPHLSVAENIGFGLKMKGVAKAEIDSTVKEMLALVKLEAMAGRKTSQLSGGQQQRVALARALAPRPKVLLLDEPLSALDLKLRKEMQVELKRLQTETGITFVFVTHDQEEALTMSDRIAVMSAGRIQQLGAPREIYTKPRNRFVASFIGETNFLNATAVAGGGKLASGQVIAADTAGKSGPVTLAVRPEHVTITAADEAGAIPAEVLGSVYFGTDMNYQLALPDGSEIEACVQSGVSGEASIAKGAKVGIRFAPGSVLLLED